MMGRVTYAVMSSRFRMARSLGLRMAPGSGGASVGRLEPLLWGIAFSIRRQISSCSSGPSRQYDSRGVDLALQVCSSRLLEHGKQSAVHSCPSNSD